MLQNRDEAAAIEEENLAWSKRSNMILKKKVDLLDKRNSELIDMVATLQCMSNSMGKKCSNKWKWNEKERQCSEISNYRNALKRAKNDETIETCQNFWKNKEIDSVYHNKIQTRGDDGLFNTDMRLCVMSLFSLIIVVANISKAFKAVS
jgi:hypothetical protein